LLGIKKESKSMVRTIGLIIAIIIISYTGILLSKSEYPFGTFLITIHKLLSLAVVVIIGVATYKSSNLMGINLIFIIPAIILYVISILSGGAVSEIQNVPIWVIWTHRIGAWLAVITMILYTTRVVRL